MIKDPRPGPKVLNFGPDPPIRCVVGTHTAMVGGPMARARLTVGRKLALLTGIGFVVASAIGVASYASTATVNSTSRARAVLNDANVVLLDLDMQESNVQIAQRDELLAVVPSTQQA